MIATTEGHDDRIVAYLREGRRLQGKAICDGLRWLGRALHRLVSRPAPQVATSRRAAA